MDNDFRIDHDYVEEPDFILSEEDEATYQSYAQGRAERIVSRKYEPLTAFDSIAEFLYFYDVGLNEGGKSLNSWQTDITNLIAKDEYSREHRLRLGLVTCNGSGKDAYIICGSALFLACCRIRHRVIITTASYTQLKNQTQNYIRTLANTINYKMEQAGFGKILIVKRDHIICTTTGSEIIMFVTDEAGRAEGYHPFPDSPESQVTIIVNEAKSVSDDVFTGIRRCTYTRLILVSSPGGMDGYFYNFIQRAREWNEGYRPGKTIYKRVTAYQCPHIPKESIEDAIDEMGESHPLFRSMYLAEFVSQGSDVVILKEWIDRIITNPPEYKPLPYKQYGVDLSAGGGDETTIYRLEGNKISRIDAFYNASSNSNAHRVVEVLRKDGADPTYVFVDDGGVGREIINRMWELGFKVNRVLNQSSSVFKSGYANRGAELYFNVRRIFEEGLVILPKDDVKLESQLTNRHFKTQPTTGKILLEPKAEARKNGRGSPDRADAVILAFCGLSYEDFSGDIKDIVARKAKRFEFKTNTSKYDPDIQAKRSLKTIHEALATNQPVPMAASNRLGTGILLPSSYLLEQEGSTKDSNPSNNPLTFLSKFS